MEIKINTKQKYKNLKGEDIQYDNKDNLTLGNVLAEILLQPHEDKQGFRPLESWDLAKKFYSQGEVEVNLSEFIQLRELVEKSKAFIVMVVAQTIEMLENARLTSEVKKK